VVRLFQINKSDEDIGLVVIEGHSHGSLITGIDDVVVFYS